MLELREAIDAHYARGCQQDRLSLENLTPEYLYDMESHFPGVVNERAAFKVAALAFRTAYEIADAVERQSKRLDALDKWADGVDELHDGVRDDD